MQIYQIRARGQSALFAGAMLLLFIPFFSLTTLTPSGFATAQQMAFRASNDAPLLAWASAHLGLLIVFPLLETIPLISILVLPYALRRIVFGEGGAASQWVGIAGLVVTAFTILLNLALELGAAQQFNAASAADRAAIGASYWITAGNEALFADILGGVLLAAWLWMVSFPLARMTGYERWVGVAGLIGAAIFGSSAALVAFNPRETHTALVGAALGYFGLWLGMVGYLLIIRAIALGSPDAPTAEETLPQATVPQAEEGIPSV